MLHLLQRAFAFFSIQYPLQDPHWTSSVPIVTPKPIPPTLAAFSYSPRLDPWRNIFEKRDICSDVLGPTRMDSTCKPSNTFCCLDSSSTFPQCQTHFGIGWCVVSSNTSQNAYVDMVSVCDQPGSVPCTYLAAGASQACCPKSMTCATDWPNSPDDTRCQMTYGELLKSSGDSHSVVSVANSASSSTSSSTSATSSLTTLGDAVTRNLSSTTSTTIDSASRALNTTTSYATIASGTSHTTEPTNTPAPTSPEKSPNNTAVIVVLAIVPTSVAALVTYMVMRRRMRRRKLQQISISNGHHTASGWNANSMGEVQKAPQVTSAPAGPTELDAWGRPAELQSGRLPTIYYQLP